MEDSIDEEHLEEGGDEEGDDSRDGSIFFERDLSDEFFIAGDECGGDPDADEDSIKIIVKNQQQNDEDIGEAPNQAVQRAKRVF